MSEFSDPNEIVSNSVMTFRQKVVLALCVILNGLDGFDVLSISFAAPGLSQDWGIDRAQLGIVLSMELFGMAAGSILLGQLADRVGRRTTTLLCLTVMASGMFLAAMSRNPIELALVRFVTGLGIGGLLASISAIAASVSNNKSRIMSVALMAAGYPLGAVVGGTISSQLLVDGNWRDVFLLGASLTAILIPVTYFILPEDFDSILRRYTGTDLLNRVNRSLKMLGHETMSEVRDLPVSPKPSFSELLRRPLSGITMKLTAVYFLHMISFYFMLKWVPKLVADQGFEPASAATVLVWANIGGVVGSLLFSLLTARLSLKKLIVLALMGSTIFLALFGFAPNEIFLLSLAAGAAGFCSNAAIVGLYALTATSYPSHLRGGGTGLVIGLGRGGSALGPVLGGTLFSIGFDRTGTMLIMAAGSACAAAVVLFLIKSTKKTEATI
jgi:benzoate transport